MDTPRWPGSRVSRERHPQAAAGHRFLRQSAYTDAMMSEVRGSPSCVGKKPRAGRRGVVLPKVAADGSVPGRDDPLGKHIFLRTMAPAATPQSDSQLTLPVSPSFTIGSRASRMGVGGHLRGEQVPSGSASSGAGHSRGTGSRTGSALNTRAPGPMPSAMAWAIAAVLPTGIRRRRQRSCFGS